MIVLRQSADSGIDVVAWISFGSWNRGLVISSAVDGTAESNVIGGEEPCSTLRR